MGKTVSFVARDELAEWLEERAEAEMKSISAVCQDIVAAEYRRQHRGGASKTGQTGFEAASVVKFESKREADIAREQYAEWVSGDDDARLKEVTFAEGTPGEVVEDLEMRANSLVENVNSEI